MLADRFSIAACPRARVSPSGQPSMARRWFSNWLVSAPSIVQWPELCTRGAISFATRPAARMEELDGQARRGSRSAAMIAREPALSARLQRGVGIGRDRRAQDAVAMHVSGSG